MSVPFPLRCVPYRFHAFPLFPLPHGITCFKVYSPSPCTRKIQSIRLHLALEKSMMPPISKFQRPADYALRVGSKYMVYMLLTHTAMEIAVCPISVVHTFLSPQIMPMTYAYALRCAMRVYISANTVSPKY